MPADKPNIVFFFTDDQRFNTIHSLGATAVSTPNIDRLVSRGTAFTRAHIPGGTVGAICMPSRAMLHTSKTLFHLQDSGRSIPEDHTLLGEVLGAAGYRTFGTGKWHNGRESFNRSFSDGDEIFFGGMSDHWNVPAYHYDPEGKYDTKLPIIDDPARSNEVRHRPCDHIHSGKHSSELVCDAAIDFIRSADRETPFFTYISFLAPHDPRSMPREFLDMYDPDDIELPPNFCGGHPFDNGDLHVRDEMLAGFPRTPEEVRRHIAEYYAMISHLDAQLGRVLDTLDEQRLTDNTIFVFAGDNGLAVGQHGLFGKQSCYDHSIRVPLIFAGPGVPENARTDAYAYLLDIYPTLCDLTRIPIPDSVQGVSLLPVLENPSHRVRETLGFAYRELQRAVKDDRFKLIEYVVGGRHTHTQLFDLQEDPWEMVNLAEDRGHADTVTRLRALMADCRDRGDERATEWGKTFWEGFGRG